MCSSSVLLGIRRKVGDDELADLRLVAGRAAATAGVPGIDPRLVEAAATASRTGLGRGDQLDRAGRGPDAWPDVPATSYRLGEIYSGRLLIGEGVTQSTSSPDSIGLPCSLRRHLHT